MAEDPRPRRVMLWIGLAAAALALYLVAAGPLVWFAVKSVLANLDQPPRGSVHLTRAAMLLLQPASWVADVVPPYRRYLEWFAEQGTGIRAPAP